MTHTDKPVAMLAVAAALAASLCGTAPAHASTLTFDAVLSGANESPGNASPGSGLARLIWDQTAHTMEVQVNFADLQGNTTASHIHCCTALADTGNAGVATVTPTFTGFPGGVSSGSYDHVFDLGLASSWNPAFVSAKGSSVATAEATLLQGLKDNKAYFNIHTSAFPSGEIRGFLHQELPEPTSLALLAMGLAGLRWSRRTRRGAP